MYSYNPYYANYLMHYGTPKHSGRYPWGSGERPYQHGGKIGFRKYQNRDGSLTLEGRQYLHEKLSKPEHSYDKLNTKDRVLKKGSSAYRVTAHDEPLDEKRKYLSTKIDDHRMYQSMWDMLPIKDANKLGDIKYELVKDIKVKNANDVLDYAIEKYGGKKINALKDAKMLSQKYDISFETDLPTIQDKKARIITSNLLAKSKSEKFGDVFEKHVDEILDHYKKEGYTAIEDAIDNSFAKSAIIMSTPVNNLKVKSRHNWAENDFI